MEHSGVSADEETRQRTQLAKGVSPETLAEKETVNQSRTYRPTSRDLERQYVSLQTQIDSVEKLLGKNSIYQETEPDGEAEEQMRTLRAWKGILERERDSLAVPYYTMENEEKRSALAGDREGQRQFQSIGESREDMRRLGELLSGYDGSESGQRNLAYLTEKYGMTERELRQKAPQLIRELQGQWDAGVEQLDGLGYDYDRMMGYDKRLQNARRDALRQEKLEKFAREHPVWASAASLGMAPLQAAEFEGTALSGIGHSDPTDLKNYVPMDPHSMRATNAVNTLRGTVAREIEENTDWELFGQNVASFLYQTGMSIGDSALQVGTLGRAATLFMGGSAAANQARSVLERGGSNSQAFWGGLASGAAEMLFEYASIDNLLTPRTVTGWESFLKETAKQAGVEGSEELFTEIANILSDAAIMGEKSETAWKTAEYESLGMSREEAEKRTFLDCIGQAAWAAAGGALSGAVMGGAVNGANLVETRQTALVSDATADQMLLERTTVDFLTRKGGLKLRKGMTQEQKRAAIRQAVENVVHKEKPANGRKTRANRFLTQDDLSEYLRTGTREHVRNQKMEQILRGESPILTTLSQVKSFIRAALSGQERDVIKGYGKVGERMTEDLRAKGIDVADYYMEIDANRIAHISDHIDDDGDFRNIPLTQQQVEDLTTYIDEYDDILNVIQRKDGSVRVLLGKQISDKHTIIVQLISKGRKSIQPVTAWINDTEHYLKKYGK